MSPALRRAATTIGVVMTAFVLALPPANAAYPGPSHYKNNACVDYKSSDSIDNSGAEACFWQVSFRRNYSGIVAGGAYDYSSDGFYAESTLTIEQLSPSRVVVSRQTQTTTTEGYAAGTSAVGRSFTFAKVSTSSMFRVTLRACTVNANHVRQSCGSKARVYNWG